MTMKPSLRGALIEETGEAFGSTGPFMSEHPATSSEATTTEAELLARGCIRCLPRRARAGERAWGASRGLRRNRKGERTVGVDRPFLVGYDYAGRPFLRRRRATASPARPVATSVSVAGSGVRTA